MKIWLDEEEWYPVPTPEPYEGPDARDVPDEIVAKWKAARDAFRQACTELEDAYRAADSTNLSAK
jgi:hypothetical protein